MPTQVILLERVEKLGAMGDVVAVKPGYARNYLLPQAKALRATKENIAYFEAQKAHLQKANAERKGEAEKIASKVEATKVVIIRQASEGGQLYGSVTSRDIAEILANESKQNVTRGQVYLNTNVKTIGMFLVDVILHPEVKVKVSVNVARTPDEAVTQAKTGKAVLAEGRNQKSKAAPAELDDAKSSMLEEGALANEKANEQAEAEEEAKATADASERAAKKAAKKPKKVEEPSEAAAEGDVIGQAPETAE